MGAYLMYSLRYFCSIHSQWDQSPFQWKDSGSQKSLNTENEEKSPFQIIETDVRLLFLFDCSTDPWIIHTHTHTHTHRLIWLALILRIQFLCWTRKSINYINLVEQVSWNLNEIYKLSYVGKVCNS